MRLQGKRALITAAGQGIGRATAEAFAREGAETIAIDINPDLLKDFGAGEVRALDVTDARAIRKAGDDIGPVDILFNVVGYVHAGTIMDCEEADWRRSWEINVTSMYHMIRTFLPAMRQAGRGSIINMSSAASSIKGVPNRFVYTTTKAAVIGLTKSIAADYVTQGIRCNAICPGTVDTPSLQERIAAQALQQELSEDEVRSAFVRRQPMGRIGTAEEIAALAVYLASDESAFTTGTAQVIDGCLSN
jgi:2-keto-3-deoxy-L-fuconate dehydrogenase